MTKESERRIRQIWDQADPLESSALPSASAVLSPRRGLHFPGFPAFSCRSVLRGCSAENAAMSSAAVLLAVITGYFSFSGRQSSVTLLAEGDKAQYTLPDGTNVWLNKNSRLEYGSSFESGKRTVKLLGEAFFDVAKDALHPFAVETGAMTIKVLGTRFTVSAYENENQSAWLEEGKIEVNGRNLENTELHPDQSIHFDGSGWKVSDTPASCHTSWISDRLTMENMPLDEVVSSLEHWFNVGLSLKDPAKAHGIKLSMTVRGESLATILETISLLSGETVSIR